MMKNSPYIPKLPFAMSALCLLLSACGGGSNNISSANNNTNSQSLCSTSDTNCVDLVFDDTPIANLNFECGVYFGTTGNTGVARCPINSTAKFSIKTSKGRKINLGQYVVKPVRIVYASELLDTSLIRVSVKDLAENIAGGSISSLDDNSAAVRTALNLSRLLQSVGLKSEPYIATAPVNRVFIDKDLVNGTPAQAATSTSPAVTAKPGLDLLTEDVAAADFKDDTFSTKLQPWLDANGRTLISTAEAKSRLQKTFLAIKSGFYYGTPSQRLTIGKEGTEEDLDLGISGNGTVRPVIQVTNAVYTLTGRNGGTIGYGMQWASEDPKTEKQIFEMFTNTTFAKMRVSSGGVNPYTSRFDNFKFIVSRAVFVGDEDNSYTTLSTPSGSKKYEDTFETGNIFGFVNGKLQRDLVIPGTETAYKKYLDVDRLDDNTELGTWEQRTDPSNSTGDRIYAGRATVSKIGAVNTYLDPKVWRVRDLVARGQNYIFPLYAMLTFRYTDASVEECKKLPGANDQTCPASRTLNVVFLENGDIWTSRNSTTSACIAPVVEPTSSQQKDVQVGTVRAAFLSTDGSQYYISPTIILSGKEFGKLDGVQIGTSALAPRVKINVTGVREAAAGSRGSLNLTSAEPITDSNGDGLNNTDDGLWVNGYNSYIINYVAYAESLAEDDATKAPPAALKVAATQAFGVLKIDPSSCYRVPTK